MQHLVPQTGLILVLALWVQGPSIGQDPRKREPQRIEVSASLIAISPDGKRLATCGGVDEGEVVTIWDLPSGKVQATLKPHAGQVRALAFSPDGKWLATGGADRNVGLWDAQSLAPKATLQGHERAVNTVAFSPDGKLLASGGNDRSVIVWSVAECSKIATFHDDEAYFVQLAFSPNSARLTGAGLTRTVSIWNPVSGRTLTTIAPHTDEVEAVAFLGDDRVASTGLDRLVRVWDLVADREVLQVEGSAGGCLAASSNGKYLASVDSKELVVVWDAKTGKRVADFGDGRRSVRSVLFAPGDRTIVYADGASVVIQPFEPEGKRP